MNKIVLSEDQQSALDQLTAHRSGVTILTGAAGSGKSTVIGELRRRKRCAICATTGRAALHINGCTVDSMFSIDRREWRTRNPRTLRENMHNTPTTIVIDESSMIGQQMGDCLYEAAAKYNKSLILVGDWAQARPVKDDWIVNSLIMSDISIISLKHNHRQSDGQFLDALNEIRLGRITDLSRQTIARRVCVEPPDGEGWLRMYATNSRTREYNNRRLNDLVEAKNLETFTLETTVKDCRPERLARKYPMNHSAKQAAIEASRMAHYEQFAVGCRVIISMNSGDLSYANGDTGTLIAAEDGWGERYDTTNPIPPNSGDGICSVTVKLDRGPVVNVPQVKLTQKTPTGMDKYTVVGLPIHLGWGLTIHKSQGMTCNRAWVDMESIMSFPDDASRHGLAYVALSRVRSLDGLLLSRWVEPAIYSDPAISMLL